MTMPHKDPRESTKPRQSANMNASSNLSPKGPSLHQNTNQLINPRENNASSSTTVEKPRRRMPKFQRDQEAVKTKVVSRYSTKHDQDDLGDENLSSASDQGSDLKVGSEEFRRSHPRRASALAAVSNAAIVGDSSETTSTSLSLSSDSLDSSIHKFRDDFDDFKCKMRIFGESLNLCKCIANDFKGRLTHMESKLLGLEKRQKHIKTQSNYTAIIKKNKELETKTKAYIAKLQKCGTEEEMREVVGRICKNYLHGFWKVVQPQELKFRRISGGLSNFIYVIGLPDDPKPLFARLNEMEEDDVKAIKNAIETGDEPKQVLLRIYGQVHGERAMDAIVTESVIFTLLSERRLGPKLFGVFSGGRIEEFIPARPLTTKELSEPAISMKIAEKTAAIHSMDIPLSKEPNYIWKTMYKWLKTIKEECFNNGIKGKNEVEHKAIKRLKEINYDIEIEWLKKYLLTFESVVVFCHNDLQEGNILLLEDDSLNTCDEYESEYLRNYSLDQNTVMKEDNSRTGFDDDYAMDATDATTKTFISQAELLQSRVALANEEDDTALSEPPGEPKLFLIDFEYCAYNYRAFDIANHFCEWAYDYTNPEHPFYFERQEPPTLEQKEIFIREYLKFYNANLSDDKQPTDPDIDAVNKLLAEVEAFALASHLFWTLWSIVNASKSQIPFGYWEYSVTRLENYLRLKQEVIKKEQYGLPQKRKIEEVDI